jgi:hypothetical protein
MHYSQDPFTKHHNDYRKKKNQINKTTIMLTLTKPKQTLKVRKLISTA